MPVPAWVPIVAALAGGGAAGACITALVTSFRNRVQPVAYRLQARELFSNASQNGALDIKVSVSEAGIRHEFDNLYELDIEIINTGNVDRPTFDFGLTLPAKQQAVLVEGRTTDRHHRFTSLPTLSPENVSRELDIQVNPFNRGDRYGVVLYINRDDDNTLIGGIDISSPQSVIFKPIPVPSELVLEYLRVLSFIPGNKGIHELITNVVGDRASRDIVRRARR